MGLRRRAATDLPPKPGLPRPAAGFYPGSFLAGNLPPVFRAETLFHGGEQQGVFQPTAALEQEKLRWLVKAQITRPFAEQKLYWPGYCRIRPTSASWRISRTAWRGAGEWRPQSNPAEIRRRGPNRCWLPKSEYGGFGRPRRRGLAVVGEDPGLSPNIQGEGVGVTLVHLAAGLVTDVGQDEGAGHHPASR